MTFLKKYGVWLLVIAAIAAVWYFYNESKKNEAKLNVSKTNANTGIVPPGADIDYTGELDSVNDYV